MEITLTPEMEKLISRKIEAGKYNSASELVQESLHRMFEADQQNKSNSEKQRQIETLHQEIKKGVEQIRNGEGIKIDVDDLDVFADEIIRRGMERQQGLGKN